MTAVFGYAACGAARRPGHRRPVPGAGRVPDDARRDEPPPLLPSMRFRPGRDLFLHTLAWLPEVREPWLRTIYDRVRNRTRAHPDAFW